MPGTGAGWDSCLYRVFIVLGIIAIVSGTVISALILPPGSQVPLYIGVGGMAVFMVLLIGYWVVQILLKGYGGLKAPDTSQKASVDDLSILQSWDKLFAAMVIHQGDSESVQKAVKKGNSSLYIWFLWAAVIALCPIALMLPYAFGILEWSYIKYGVLFYIGIVLFMSFLTFFLGSRAKEASEEVIFAPLGLKVTELPQVRVVGTGPKVRGGSVMEGVRFGRAVRVRMDVGSVTTQIQYPSPQFRVNSPGGDLQAENGAPKSVHDGLRSLCAAKRWDGLQITGGPDGITATRDARGQNMWLYDIWLIERIINEFEREKKG